MYIEYINIKIINIKLTFKYINVILNIFSIYTNAI